MIQPQPTQTLKASAARLLEQWRAAGFAFVVLQGPGKARCYRSGQLSFALGFAAARRAKVLELAAPDALQILMRWHLALARPTNLKGIN